MAYGLYLATIVGGATLNNEDKPNDNRIQVKVTPQMDSIADADCPMWPFFFKDELFTGRTGELVWVVCDNYFQMGYVLGLANNNTYSSMGGSLTVDNQEKGLFESNSLSKNLCDTLMKALYNLNNKTYELNDIKVTYWDDNTIHFVERETGGTIMAFSNGSLFIMRPEEFFISIGNSGIKLGKDTFSVSAPKIYLDSTDVGLGHEPSGNVNVTIGSDSTHSKVSKNVRA